MLQDSLYEVPELFAALRQCKRQMFFMYPNADAGSRRLIQLIENFVAARNNAHLFVNFDHTTYLSLLRNSAVLIGNSSSGIIESTSLGIPAINIGIRQRGREHAGNVIDVPAERKAILAALKQASDPTCRKKAGRLRNPYGDGRAGARIVSVLTQTPLNDRLLFKA
jgi:UDP-N-acetylglucosamine 2-epimerase